MKCRLESFGLRSIYPAERYHFRRIKLEARIGNSVVPVMSQALVSANCPYLRVGDRTPNCIIGEDQSGQLKFA